MIIIGCDYHPGFQQIAFVDTDTGEFQERRLSLEFETLWAAAPGCSRLTEIISDCVLPRLRVPATWLDLLI
jgi:hypothetical protein